MKKLVSFFLFRAFCVFYKKNTYKKIYGLGLTPPLYGHDRKKYVFFDALPKTEVKLLLIF